MSVSPGSQPTHSGSVHSSNGSMLDADLDGRPQDQPMPQKRKGGRKPIYATSEERKQRNRQAQAAFRERRTEYIKQLEVTIKQNEDQMQALRQNHRSAADEVHLLRYQNSLLERILVEKGYDVQAELQCRSNSPVPRLQHASPVSPGPPIMQQAIMNRHQQARRSTPGASAKLDSDFNAPPIQSLRISPTAPSHMHTPTSSSFSSPAMAFNGMSVVDSRGGNQVSQPPHVQNSQQSSHMLPAHYNYSAFSTGFSNGSHHQSEPSDASKYSSAGYTGYHTPTSIDEAQRSRNSSMAQTAMTSLDSDREPSYQTTSSHAVNQQSNGLSYYGSQMPHQSMHMQPELQATAQFSSQRASEFMPIQSSGGYPSHLYGGSYQGMLPSNHYPQGDMFSLSTSMQYPTNFTFDAGPLR